MKSFLVIVAAVSAKVQATSNHGSNSGSDFSQYVYSEVTSLNLPENREVLDCNSEYGDLSDSSASVVSSSLLYEGGCVVSAQALMCNGGDSLNTAFAFDSDADLQESDDEDNDDDDDDGHSSLLSNASLRSSVALASGSAKAPIPAPRQSSVTPAATGSTVACINLKSQGVRSALLVRGGASDDVTKKLMVAAVVTVLFEGTIGHVLELFKIVMQTSPSGTSYLSVYNDITNKKGIAGLWDGFAPWGLIQAVLKVVVFLL